ncbi:Pyruvate kinase [hydrothermal vent metagenome]|uniref:pyruvate kinase n=1 Tax=hydrothermal vent metagenome TaxID=652676 RepID=A0A3B0Y2M8_9ZZZZ
MRRTKIVATLGPSTDSQDVIDDLVQAGVDVVRLNYSHGSHEEQSRRVKMVRTAAEKFGRVVGVLADLQGPKIRTERFVDGKVYLNEGDAFFLDADLDRSAGTVEGVGITYRSLPGDVAAGNRLVLDDGRMLLDVVSIEGFRINCIVAQSGYLSDKKGINLEGGGLSAPALTDKDKEDIKSAAKIQADYLAVSFPKSADDIHQARKLLREAGGYGAIVSKIERAEALECIDEIIEASDVIMVARGDLGVEIGDAELPAVQKDLIAKARSMDRIVITATQMMESMIDSSIPTRAEVFDVANAVHDGTDAVMLSGETAAGEYPVETVLAMGRICEAAEQHPKAKVSDHRMTLTFGRVDEALAMATMYTANHLNVDGIAALTESGSTVLWMSRISSGIPIYAMTRHQQTRRKVTLYRGVYPTSIDFDQVGDYNISSTVACLLKEKGIVEDGNRIIITRGDALGDEGGGTNAMKVITIGNICDSQN